MRPQHPLEGIGVVGGEERHDTATEVEIEAGRLPGAARVEHLFDLVDLLTEPVYVLADRWR